MVLASPLYRRLFMRPIGLYIHIPFCDGKCRYCSFFSVRQDDAAFEAYTDNLCRILVGWGGQINPSVATVYFGGGTPSLLGHERLIRILKTVKASFSVAPDAEITVEVNPSSSAQLDFAAIRRAGFNRLSIGLQSANDDELRLLGRRHSVEDVRYTVQSARDAGFDNISLDVMLAIPGQTTASLDRTLKFCASMKVQHISAYILKVEEGTPFGRMRDRLAFYGDEDQAAFYEYAVGRLNELGYEQYEISNFAKDGMTGRHNLLYWHDEEYLGVGPSAHSFLDGRRFYYGDSFEDFARDITLEEGVGGDRDEYIMLALRLSEGLNFEHYRERFGEEISRELLIRAEKLKAEGYVNLTPASLSLTVKGFLVSNAVIAYLIENT